MLGDLQISYTKNYAQRKYEGVDSKKEHLVDGSTPSVDAGVFRQVLNVSAGVTVRESSQVNIREGLGSAEVK